jgi:deoxycytidylate deaminase
MIINAGIVRIVIRESYHDRLAEEMLREAAISVVKIQPPASGAGT